MNLNIIIKELKRGDIKYKPGSWLWEVYGDIVIFNDDHNTTEFTLNTLINYWGYSAKHYPYIIRALKRLSTDKFIELKGDL